ncbi:hypothetical protein B0H19DRAFT_1367471 [Mycena capillaripes]|nr:hypothetical protein B0H19DRAFT_1367471 [Mycena capillaripes]
MHCPSGPTSTLPPMLNTLEADRARVTELEPQIIALERSPSALPIERRLAQERLDSYKYPVLTLPNEIVSEIFIHFLPIYPLCPPLTGILSPAKLTHICRHWREIALGNPMLWRAISLCHNEAPLTRQLQRSEIWLNRSLNCPLSIVVDHYQDLVPEILAVLVPYRARWEHAELFDMSPCDLPFIRDTMPLLQYLNLSLDGRAPNVIVFEDIPQLHTVVLTTYAIADVTLPWAQLASLTLNGVTRHECLTILPQATSLRHCTLQLDFFARGIELSADPHELKLPSLKSLTLDDNVSFWSSTTRFPDVFIVPALRSLKILESFLRPDPIDALTSFISMSHCKLEKVGIMGRRFVTKDSFRRAFQTIDFSFDHQDLDDN